MSRENVEVVRAAFAAWNAGERALQRIAEPPRLTARGRAPRLERRPAGWVVSPPPSGYVYVQLV